MARLPIASPLQREAIMARDPAERLLHPLDDSDRNALACLLRLRSEGKDLAEIARGLRAETGFILSPPDLDRVLREIAGPVPREDGGDPEYFSGYLGGG
jgi:hypothetical protein